MEEFLKKHSSWVRLMFDEKLQLRPNLDREKIEGAMVKLMIDQTVAVYAKSHKLSIKQARTEISETITEDTNEYKEAYSLAREVYNKHLEAGLAKKGGE